MTEAELDRTMRLVLLDAIALDLESAPDAEPGFLPSRRHSGQMRRMLRDPLRWARDRDRGMMRKTARWAAVVLLFISLSFGMVMLFSAPARAALERWILEWYETLIVYRYSGESEGTLPRYEFTGLPEGFEELERMEVYQFTYVLYGNGNGELMSFTYQLMAQGGATVIVPNDDAVIEVKVGRNRGTLFVPQNPQSMKTLTWIDEKAGVHFTLVADLDESDIIKLAESLRREKKNKLG